MWCGLEPPDLPTYCDSCNTKFTICHALDCKRGGVITVRHNEICDEVAYLAGKAFTPSHMRDNHLIFAGRSVKRTKATPAGAIATTDRYRAPPPEVMDQKRDLLIPFLWQNGTDSFHDIRVVNAVAKSHTSKTLEKCLQEAERGKKRMYLDACLHQHRHFYPFFASVDGLLGVEATTNLKRLDSRLATKWKQPYSKMCGYVNSRISTSLVRATHRCIRGSWVPAHQISVQRPQWEDGAGLNLFR